MQRRLIIDMTDIWLHMDRAYLREREKAIDRSALVIWDRAAELLLEAVMRILDKRK